jgi:hypothetical protein
MARDLVAGETREEVVLRVQVAAGVDTEHDAALPADSAPTAEVHEAIALKREQVTGTRLGPDRGDVHPGFARFEWAEGAVLDDHTHRFGADEDPHDVPGDRSREVERIGDSNVSDRHPERGAERDASPVRRRHRRDEVEALEANVATTVDVEDRVTVHPHGRLDRRAA